MILVSVGWWNVLVLRAGTRALGPAGDGNQLSAAALLVLVGGLFGVGAVIEGMMGSSDLYPGRQAVAYAVVSTPLMAVVNVLLAQGKV